MIFFFKFVLVWGQDSLVSICTEHTTVALCIMSKFNVHGLNINKTIAAAPFKWLLSIRRGFNFQEGRRNSESP